MININISEKTKMHIAALFAGDGMVRVEKNKKSGKLYISLEFGYKPILDIISNILKYGNVRTYKKSEYEIRNFHKQSWCWLLFSNDAMAFLKMILPYLPEKWEQSREGIEFQEWKNKNIIHGRSITKSQEAHIDKVIETIENLKKQFTTIEHIEEYDLFKKKHYDPDIENGRQNTFANFDDDYYIQTEKEKELVKDVKKIVSPDINLDVIEKMTAEGFGGWFDAEGSVRITKNDLYKNPSYILQLSISNNSNFYILDKYCKTFSGNLTDPTIKEYKKITWTWEINATKALKFLKIIEPYTFEKKEQIGLAIEFQERRNNNTLTQERAKEIFQRIKDIKNIEYMVNGKIRETPHGYSDVEKRKMKKDKNLVEKELKDYKKLWDEYENNGRNIVYDENNDDYNCNENDNYDNNNIDKNQRNLNFE